MVSTRHTRPPSETLPFESTRYATARKGTVSRALRKLIIDGNDGLRGERETNPPPAREVKVYHWRGAVYAVDENTPEEWIEAQPKRYLKRKREPDDDGDDEGSGRRRRKTTGTNEDDDYDDDYDEKEQDEVSEDEMDEDHEPTLRKSRDSSQPAPQPQKRGPGRPRKHERRDPLPSSSSSSIRTPRSHHKKRTASSKRPVTPRSTQSASAQRGRPRSKHNSTTKPARAKSMRNAVASHASTLNNTTSSRPASTSYHNARSNPVSTPLNSEQDHPQIAPIPWADMMAGRIAVSMTKFLAVQTQLRKIQHEYALARDLHARVVARENSRAKKRLTNGHTNGRSVSKNADVGLASVPRSVIDVDRTKLGASVQRTDSRLSRREDQAMDNTHSSAISIAASDDGHRERASSFDTAPSHAELSPRSHQQNDHHYHHAHRGNHANQQNGRPAIHITDQALHSSMRISAESSRLEELLSNQDNAAYLIASDKRLATETPEEKSRRLNREWDKVMAWPQRSLSKHR